MHVRVVKDIFKFFFLMTILVMFPGPSEAQIAVFPFEDLTRGVAGINMEISSHVAEVLREMGYQVVPPERIVTFLAANRLRWTGWSDQVTARKVEDELKARGGNYSKADDWHPYAITDGNLITGQNPASSELAAKAVLEMIK